MANTTPRTMEVVLEDIKVNIDTYNATATSEPEKRNELTVKLVELEKEHAELSLLHAYATFMEDEMPVVAFAKAYTYGIVGHKDVPHRKVVNGAKTVEYVRVLDEDKTRLLNVADFLTWAYEGGKPVSAAKDWRSKTSDARSALKQQWKRFLESNKDTSTIKVGYMKNALQAMVDSIVFIPGKDDKNKVIVTSQLTRSIFAFTNTRKDGIRGDILSDSTWKKLQMDILHAAVEGKTFELTYGEDEPIVEEEPAAEAPVEVEAE